MIQKSYSSFYISISSLCKKELKFSYHNPGTILFAADSLRCKTPHVQSHGDVGLKVSLSTVGGLEAVIVLTLMFLKWPALLIKIHCGGAVFFWELQAYDPNAAPTRQYSELSLCTLAALRAFGRYCCGMGPEVYR